jgi:hypothetical protein
MEQIQCLSIGLGLIREHSLASAIVRALGGVVGVRKFKLKYRNGKKGIINYSLRLFTTIRWSVLGWSFASTLLLGIVKSR